MYKLKLKSNFGGIFNKKTFTFEEGITFLIGPSSSGKSVLLKEFSNYCYNTNILHYYYDSFNDVIHNKNYDTNLSNSNRIIAGFSYITNTIINDINKSSSKEEIENLFIILDNLDHGIALDKFDELKGIINNLYNKLIVVVKHVYIIIAAATYELVINEKCIPVGTARQRTFNTYNSYIKFIKRESEILSKRKEFYK